MGTKNKLGVQTTISNLMGEGTGAATMQVMDALHAQRPVAQFANPQMSAVYGLNKPEAKQGYGPDGSFPTLEEYEEAKRMGIVQ